MASPFLSIRRIVVRGKLSCDLSFNAGLNVIKSVLSSNDPKSTNKVGKTSLVELIQYGLGRQVRSRAKWYFAPIAGALNQLWLEIEANEKVVTIQRSLQELTANARIHQGAFGPGMEKADLGDSVPIEELSDFLLALLGIPKVAVKQADGSSFYLSFPNLMRTFVLHQEDSFGQILDKIIPEQRRTDILGFITRITPLERFTLEEELGRIQQEVDALQARVEAVESFLKQHGIRSLSELQQKYDAAARALSAADEERHALQEKIRADVVAGPEAGHLDKLQARLLDLKQKLAAEMQTLASLSEEQKRLEELVASLQSDRQRLSRLRASSTVLSTVEFDICPRCLNEVTREMKERENQGRCELCNRMLLVTSDNMPELRGRTEDIEEQIKEARAVIQEIQRERQQLDAVAQSTKREHEQIAAQYDLEANVFISPAVDSLLARSSEITRRQAELSRLEPILLQAQTLENMHNDLVSLRARQVEIQDQLRKASKPDKTRLALLRDLYKRTLEQVGFPDVREITINSQTFLPYINSSLYIHTGTALKGLATVCYHLALLEMSHFAETFFPSMLVVDSPAVGDLNDENHDKLLRYFVQLTQTVSPKTTPNWQIILTTRRSLPELDNFVVETLSSPNRMLLR